ncbi:hypothetical protein EAT49_06765 [Histidinibacterium lentulum]|uniref:Uncharacterized protein n=1 Tax=Histidinibacterium lentulum TaxID=2480588 RepID=A0A3N2R6D5_9RHOB|nr:hypothetical protein EAT49_06765 [Histidinibacterium lentulum]
MFGLSVIGGYAASVSLVAASAASGKPSSTDAREREAWSVHSFTCCAFRSDRSCALLATMMDDRGNEDYDT